MSDQTKEIEDKLRSAIADALQHRPVNVNGDTSNSGWLVRLGRAWSWMWSRILCPVFLSLVAALMSMEWIKGDGSFDNPKGGINSSLLMVGMISLGGSFLLSVTLYSHSFLSDRAVLISKLPCEPEMLLRRARLNWLIDVGLLLLSNIVWTSVFALFDKGLLFGNNLNWYWAPLLITINSAAITMIGAWIHCWIKRKHPILLQPFTVSIVSIFAFLFMLFVHARHGKPDAEWIAFHHAVTEFLPSTWAIMAVHVHGSIQPDLVLSAVLMVVGIFVWWKWPMLTQWRLLKTPSSNESAAAASNSPSITGNTQKQDYKKDKLAQKLHETCHHNAAFDGVLERLIGRILRPVEKKSYPAFIKGKLKWTANWVAALGLTVVSLLACWIFTQNRELFQQWSLPVNPFFLPVAISLFAGYIMFLELIDTGLSKKPYDDFQHRIYHHQLSAWSHAMITPWTWIGMMIKVTTLRLISMVPLAFVTAVALLKLHEVSFSYGGLISLFGHFALIVLSGIPFLGSMIVGKFLQSTDSRLLSGVILCILRFILGISFAVAVFYSLVSYWVIIADVKTTYAGITIPAAFTSSLLMFQIQVWRIQSGQADWILTVRKKIS